MDKSDLPGILRSLADGGVDFILVGGLSAVLNGAPVHTYDVDAVYSLEPANFERLLAVLESLDAIFRIQPGRRLRPSRSHLEGGGHLNLLTRFGPLDLLGSIGGGYSYEDLVPRSTPMKVGDGMRVRVLELAALIELKEKLGSEKDRAALPILRRTLEESRKHRT